MALNGFAGVRPNPLAGPATPAGNPFAPRYNAGSITNPYPGTAAGGGGGGRTNRLAVEGAKAYRDALGLPSWQDILGKFGGGPGTTEFGNAGAAGAGADVMRGELTDWKNQLAKQRGQLDVARGDIRNPTRTAGFRDTMRLTNERLGNAVENDRRLAAEAASRRGFVGGYNPEASDRNRLEALATAGYEATDTARKGALDQFNAEGNIYGTNLAGYNAALGGYGELTKTLAELPTKYLTAYSGLLGGLGGGFGDIFGTSSHNVMFDTENERSDQARLRQNRIDQRREMRNTPGAAGFV